MSSPENNPTVCDFSRSFIRWRNDTTKKPMLTASQPPPTTLNNVRMPLECLISVRRNASTYTEFGLGTSCKTEQVFVECDVWMDPNADMCAVSSADDFMVLKSWDRTEKGVMLHPPSLGPQPERQRIDPQMAFETHGLSLRRRSATRIDQIDEIIEAFSGDRELVSRTTYEIEGGDVTVEYPVKTVNFSERHDYYQVDTRPVLMLDTSAGDSLIEMLHMAYVAHLGGDWAEFLVNVPTRLEGHGISVYHYSDVRRVSARNSLWLVDEQ